LRIFAEHLYIFAKFSFIYEPFPYIFQQFLHILGFILFTIYFLPSSRATTTAVVPAPIKYPTQRRFQDNLPQKFVLKFALSFLFFNIVILLKSLKFYYCCFVDKKHEQCSVIPQAYKSCGKVKLKI